MTEYGKPDVRKGKTTREMKTEKMREYQTNTEKHTVNKKESDRKKELIVQRWMGCSLEMKIGASKVWQLNRVDDILNSEILE